MKLNDGTEIEFIENPDWRQDWCCAIKIIQPDGNQWGISFDQDSYREFIGHLVILPVSHLTCRNERNKNMEAIKDFILISEKLSKLERRIENVENIYF